MNGCLADWAKHEMDAWEGKRCTDGQQVEGGGRIVWIMKEEGRNGLRCAVLCCAEVFLSH